MSLGGADEGGHGWIEKVMEVGCGRKGSMHGSCMLVVEKDIIAGSFGGNTEIQSSIRESKVV